MQGGCVVNNGFHSYKNTSDLVNHRKIVNFEWLYMPMKRFLLLTFTLFLLLLQGCGKKNDTILRVYVGYNGQPKTAAKVVIDGVKQNPPYTPFVMSDYTDINGLVDFNLNDYIKAGSYGGSTVDCTVYLIKNSPQSDTIKTIYVEGFKTTKQTFLF